MQVNTPCKDHGQYGYNGGYGRRRLVSGYTYLHREVLEHTIGRPLYTGEVARHTCDNRRCVEPTHIILGTKLDNIADMVARNRQSSKEGRPLAKLTTKDISWIRANCIRGCKIMGVTAMARKFNVGIATISLALNNKTWRYNE